MTPTDARTPPATARPYLLDDQVGFLLRQVSQRHAAIFAAHMGQDITPTQWAALAKLVETGPCSQNLLGRLTAMDAATIKGVIDRLARRGLTETRPDPEDARRVMVALTPAGRRTAQDLFAAAHRVTEETLAQLSDEERHSLAALLRRMM
jgi:DNA-binding MarR family transcriptional regulator